MTTARRRSGLSLDSTVGNRLAVHEIVPAADPADGEPENDSSDGSMNRDDAKNRVLATLASDLLETKALDADARLAEAESVRRRSAHDRRAAEIEARAREYLDAAQYASLAGLSPAQLRVIQARITLAQNGEPVTHHAVARMLGVRASTVSNQWARIQRKRGEVSTSAA